MLVSGRLLADITRALPAKPVDLVVDGSRATINCGSSRFSLPTMPVEDYPQLPAMPQLAGHRRRRASWPRPSRRSRWPPAATTRCRCSPASGMEIDGPRLTLAATDRFRLAVRELDWQPEDTEQSTAVLIPARTLAEVAKTLGERGHASSSRCRRATACSGVTGAGRRATTRLLDAEFPRFRQLIPAEHTTSAIVEVAGLIESIKRVALVTDRVAQVRMEFGDDGLRLTAGGDDVGSAEEELPCELEGAPLTIAFNPGYLLDALGALHAERAQLTFTTPEPARAGPAGPAAARRGLRTEAPADAVPGYLHLLMPVRLPG